MRYFSPSYWFQMWLLSAPLFNSKNEGIYAKSIDNQNIKDWASNNTNLQLLENQNLNLFNNQTIQLQNNENIPSSKNLETDDFYENFFKTQGWSNNPEIAQKQLIEIQAEHHNFLKQEHKEIKINKRHKKQTDRPINQNIFELTQPWIIDIINPNEYMTSFRNIINELIENEFLSNIPFNNNNIYVLNTETNIRYFQIPIIIRWPQNNRTHQRRISLLFSSINLRVQGFINHDDQTYYYFHHDLTYLLINQRHSPLTNINDMNSIMLEHIIRNYRDLLPTENNNRNNMVDWNDIFYAFFRLTNDINVQEELPSGNLARALGIVLLMTTEVIRLRTWENFLNNNFFAPRGSAQRESFNILLNNHELSITLGSNSEMHYILPIWTPVLSSPRIINNVNSVLVSGSINSANSVLSRIFTNFRAQPIEAVSSFFNNSALRIIILYLSQLHPGLGCNRRNKREINNKFWEKEFCIFKPQADKIKGEVTSIKILDSNTKGGNLKSGTIYLGTDKGLYLIDPKGQVYKFDGLDFPITSMKLDNQGSAYITNNQEEVYHLDLYGWGSIKTNMKSFDLEKEIRIYYNDYKSHKWFNFDWYGSDRGEDSDGNSCPENYYRNTIIKIWNLQKINPINYKKIEFLGDHILMNCSRISWGNTQYYSNKQLYDFNGYDFHLMTKNEKIKKPITCTSFIPDYLNKWSLQQYTTESWALAWLAWCQNFGTTWYWENDDYYLQFQVSQYGDSGISTSHGTSFMDLGTGIRLYNDDYVLENQIKNHNDRKKREVFEEKSITKWTNDFTKSINHEQNLPINNKTNFATNNITSL